MLGNSGSGEGEELFGVTADCGDLPKSARIWIGLAHRWRILNISHWEDDYVLAWFSSEINIV